MSDLFAPQGGWRVRILDLSGAELSQPERPAGAGAEAARIEAPDNIVEEIGGFPTLMQANAFARRYVRDSVERCRTAAMTPHEVLEAWFAFGEDAEVVDAGDAAWRSATELDSFAARPATEEERDWRALDPRRDSGPADDGEGGPDGGSRGGFPGGSWGGAA